MAGFRLKKAYTMPKEELRVAAEGLASRLEEKHGVRSQWRGDDEVHIKGSGVEGVLTIEDGEVAVSVRLGLLASAFQGVLKAEVQRYLDEHVT